jgi:hypothetical protein
MTKHVVGSLILFAAQAGAHEGHGMPGASHWHASDIQGLLLLAGVCCALLWLSRRK